MSTTHYIGGFWGISPQSIWATSSDGVLHWDGKAWNQISSNAREQPGSRIWASGDDDVWSVVRSGVEHWDGSAWRNFRVQTLLDSGWTETVFGTAPGRVWVTGSAGLVARKKR